MRLNHFQKIVLFLYGCLFVYFSIIHVPFKANYHGEIKYDTLFSNSSNLDSGRLVIIVLVTTVLTTVLLLLLRNVNYQLTTLPKKTIKIIAYSLSGVALLFFIVWGFPKLSGKAKKTTAEIINSKSFDSTSVTTDTSATVEMSSFMQKKVETCNEEQALLDFKSYMKFYYPDWKIYGKPIVQPQSDCTFRVQFTTLDPHIRYQREVIIVEVSYTYDYEKYNFRTVRGTLY